MVDALSTLIPAGRWREAAYSVPDELIDDLGAPGTTSRSVAVSHDSPNSPARRSSIHPDQLDTSEP
jgi:hypothetical protein